MPSSSRILFLNLGSHNGILACVTESAVVHSQSVDHRIDDAVLVELIEKLLSDAQWTYQDLTQIACVVGPGGFTSLRVAVACANTLSWSLKIPVTGIHLSNLYLARCPKSEVRSPDVWWLHSTKKKELFIRGFGTHTSRVPDPVCIATDALSSFVHADDCWMGELIPDHQTLIDDIGARAAPLLPLHDILPSFLGAQSYEKRMLEPWYGRNW